jgi:hypothetical protein
MSTYFEAIILAADRPRLLNALEALSESVAAISLELHQVMDRGFVLLGWRAGARRPDAWEEMNELADELSLLFDSSLVLHYDDQCGEKISVLSRQGEPVRGFGDEDEIWVPMDDDGNPNLDAPRYPGNAIPEDEECDCIRNAIDAGLEEAGFDDWLTTRGLLDAVSQQEGWIWHRPGIKE